MRNATLRLTLTSTLAEGPAAATPAADQKQRPRRESKSAPSTVALGRLPDDAARVAPKLRAVASDLLARLDPALSPRGYGELRKRRLELPAGCLHDSRGANERGLGWRQGSRAVLAR